jgi:microcystin-dependent protein
MSDPFLGEIRMFGFNWPPVQWAVCDGQIMNIDQHGTLYSLLGVQFGGDGRTTFALPDFRGRTPVQPGSDVLQQGQKGGYETVILAEPQLPQHTHILYADTETGKNGIGDNSVFCASDSSEPMYYEPQSLTPMNSGTCTTAGGGRGHYNIQPSIGVGFCIALNGIYPPRN